MSEMGSTPRTGVLNFSCCCPKILVSAVADASNLGVAASTPGIRSNQLIKTMSDFSIVDFSSS